MDDDKLKSKLRVVLMADDQVIAETENPQLWQKVLAAITSDSSDLKLPKALSHNNDGDDDLGDGFGDSGDEVIDALAKELKIHANNLKGACDPTEESPYMHLDRRTWASWRKRIPHKGPNAVSPEAVTATLLALWFDKLKKSFVDIGEVRTVLSELGITSKNMARSINNCLWLQLKNKDQIRLHPSYIETAIDIGRAFILAVNEPNGGE